jgi:leader peptidase (prepilin peptidase) / N-methyltransferase
VNVLLAFGDRIAAIPLETRLVVVFLLGLVLGSQVNRAIYAWSWNPRSIGPWGKRPDSFPPRRWSDYLPVVGWFGLERESKEHGPYYWLRPLLIEFFFAVGITWLYAWEDNGGLLEPLPGMRGVIQFQFLSHTILMAWLAIATWIDFDEKIVPDSITIPGSLIGLFLAMLVPYSLLPDFSGVLLCASPHAWDPILESPWGAFAGCAIFVTWCYALCPKTWYWRRGFIKGLQFFVASMLRRTYTWLMLLLACLGSAAILGIWGLGNPHWQGLISSLAGMGFGLALMWSVRSVAGWAMGREALGFGDVTLMAMIGTYMGWQPILMVFVIAPFAGLFIAVMQWLFTRSHEIAYAPYLCAAAVITLICWQPLWSYWAPLFLIAGWWLPVFLVVCLLLMGILLRLMRLARG